MSTSAHSGGSNAPVRICLLVGLPPYARRLASCLSAITVPSTDIPPKRPLVLEYEYMAAIFPLVLRAPEPSALRPIGPTATERLPPSVRLPALMNVATAARELRTIKKSVTLGRCQYAAVVVDSLGACLASEAHASHCDATRWTPCFR